MASPVKIGQVLKKRRSSPDYQGFQSTPISEDLPVDDKMGQIRLGLVLSKRRFKPDYIGFQTGSVISDEIVVEESIAPSWLDVPIDRVIDISAYVSQQVSPLSADQIIEDFLSKPIMELSPFALDRNFYDGFQFPIAVEELPEGTPPEPNPPAIGGKVTKGKVKAPDDQYLKEKKYLDSIFGNENLSEIIEEVIEDLDTQDELSLSEIVEKVMELTHRKIELVNKIRIQELRKEIDSTKAKFLVRRYIERERALRQYRETKSNLILSMVVHKVTLEKEMDFLKQQLAHVVVDAMVHSLRKRRQEEELLMLTHLLI